MLLTLYILGDKKYKVRLDFSDMLADTISVNGLLENLIFVIHARCSLYLFAQGMLQKRGIYADKNKF